MLFNASGGVGVVRHHAALWVKMRVKIAP